MNFRSIAIAASALFLLLTAIAAGVAPARVSYQGRLSDAVGLPLNGNYSLTFNIYNLPGGGSLLWTETQNTVPVTDGLFNVVLGGITPFGTVFDGADRYIGVQVNGGPELAPRKQIMSVAFALRVATIDGATGGHVTGDSRIEGRVVIGTGDALGTLSFTAGANNTASGNYSNVSGADNTATGTYANVGGGFENLAGGYASGVGGGVNNTASGDSSFIGGGGNNVASGRKSFIGSGRDNLATGDFSHIGGGWLNYTAALYSTIGGGERDSATAQWATVAGGRNNNAEGGYSTIGGGTGNRAVGTRSFVGGGVGNTAEGFDATIAGGENNIINGSGSFIGSGDDNNIQTANSAICGGFSNFITGSFAAIGGGHNNVAASDTSFVGGGSQNVTGGATAGVVSGSHNTANGDFSGIGGGYSNLTGPSGVFGVISGGLNNDVTDSGGAVVGGVNNVNNGDVSTILGGSGNSIVDELLNPAVGVLVFGRNVVAGGADDRAYLFNGANPGRLSINRDSNEGGAAYPIHVGTAATNGNGARLTIAGVWTDASSRTFKENFVEIGGAELLEKIAQLSLPHYNYKGTTEKHIGPMAEDFAALFNVGSVDENTGQIDPMYLSAKDVAGVSLAGVKELIAEKNKLENRVAELERIVRSLIDSKN